MRIGLSWLDFKLGFRMLARYPMLTIVGSLAMAVAIAVGAGTFEVITRVTNPTLPLPNGDRIVGLDYWRRAESSARPANPYDVVTWREGLRAVEDVGAFRLVQRNLILGEQGGEPVQVAEISAAAFRVAGVPPLMGRALVDADESPQSPAVVVIGHRVWQMRFGGDLAVVGRVVRLGATQATVVGVMPEGFAFPVRQNLWTPLRVRELPQEAGRGPLLRAFGRLANGVALPQAQAELTTLGSRVAKQFPKEYEQAQPRVLPYAESIIGNPQDLLSKTGIHSLNAFGTLFLVVVCGNVALLMFARATTREREIVVRRALGAARSRIVMQLFAEALVLAAIAAVVALVATDVALKWALAAMSTEEEAWPFWFEGGLSAVTVAYSAGLTILAAVVAGVMPALKVTRSNMEAGLRQASAGAGGVRMGGVWTGVIVTQIAATVLFTAVAFVAQRQAAGIASAKAAFPAEQYLAVRLDLDQDGPADEGASTTGQAFLPRYEATARELERRVGAEAGVAAVTLAERLPLMPSGGGVIELDDAGTHGKATSPVSRSEQFVTTSAVDRDFFEVFQTPILAGRGFAPHDASVGANTVVVNQLFVEHVMAGRNAVGRRLRYRVKNAEGVRESGPWFEIVGVVRDLVPDPDAPMSLDNPAKPLVYHTLASSPSPRAALYLAARVRSGDPSSLLPTLRRIAAEISPTLRLSDVQRLDQATGSDARAWGAIAGSILLVSAIALLLSLAGIYAVTSFTVSRRTREIAVRLALGAPVSNVVTNVFSGPMFQVAAGVVVGCAMVGGLIALSMRDAEMGFGVVTKQVAVLLGYAALMTGICGLACIGPLLRVFRVEPTEVLRDDG